MGKYISDNEKLLYLERLIQPYKKKGITKFCIEQYLHADGGELDSKFWNKRSSSRFAFELYSWLAFDEKCIDFEFEYKLPGMASGGKTPNMDVFIETKTEIIFIESKFSEQSNISTDAMYGLPEAYWKECSYGRREMNLYQRYHETEGSTFFPTLIAEIDNAIKSYEKDPNEWFDILQETRHLIGVYLFLQQNSKLKKKKIKLYNIFWQLEGDKVNSPLEQLFFKHLQKYQSQLFRDIDFQYDAFTVQDMLSGKHKISEQFVFPDDVVTQIQSFVDYSKDRTRVEMNRL